MASGYRTGYLYAAHRKRHCKKTKAGVWALEQRLCPVEHDLKTALTVRNNPLRYKNDPDIREWAAALGPSIQRFADVLEAEIQQTAQPVDNTMGNKIYH